MINLFKKKKKQIKEEFIIGDYDFSIDNEDSIIVIDGNKLIDIKIRADKSVFNQFCEDDDFEFGFGLYPPEFYARGIDLGRNRHIIINEENHFDYEVALYFMEHNEVNIKLSIEDSWILIVGWAYINKNKYPIDIKINKTPMRK